MKVGVVGTGYWGTKILSKLIHSQSVIFFSKDPTFYFPLIDSADWVFVASPDPTHYEIVRYCLDAGVNVFCEKPLSRNFEECLELYEAAQSSQGCLYVDDVFQYRNQQFALGDSNRVIWKKASHQEFRSREDFLYRLAFHDFYLLWPFLVDQQIERVESLPTSGALDFSIKYQSGWKVNFSYDVNSTVVQHTINGCDLNAASANDYLQIMLDQVLAGNADFAKNHAGTLFASKTIKEILSGW